MFFLIDNKKKTFNKITIIILIPRFLDYLERKGQSFYSKIVAMSVAKSTPIATKILDQGVEMDVSEEAPLISSIHTVVVEEEEEEEEEEEDSPAGQFNGHSSSGSDSDSTPPSPPPPPTKKMKKSNSDHSSSSNKSIGEKEKSSKKKSYRNISNIL